MLSLGDGQGQDSRYFLDKGFKVLASDISKDALKISKTKAKKLKLKNIAFKEIDLKKKFPFKNETFDVVYSHLSAHYFNRDTTKQIFDEVLRVLKKGGVFAVFVNSINDPEFNTGKKIEDELFEIDGVIKRYFSVESMKYFTKYFEKVLLDDKGKTYKDEAKGVHNLIRFVGTKR